MTRHYDVQVVQGAATLLAVLVLSGSNCIIDPCPVLVRRDYDPAFLHRVALIDPAGADRLELSSSERIALIDADGDDIRLSEISAATEGDLLASGGRLIARFRGSYSLDLTTVEVSLLRVVRLEQRASPLSLRLTAEWDIADCDDRTISDLWFTDLDALCGDGIVEAPEQCDDENVEADDGCTACQIDQGGCSGESWRYWTCDDEPSRCVLHDCLTGGSDPACDLLADLDLDLITNGLVMAGQAPGRIVSSPPAVDCSCVETAISYDCDLSCTMDVRPCATLAPVDTDTIEFLRWSDGCPDDDDQCSVNVGGRRIIGVFSSVRSGIEREREHTAYPLESRGLDLRLIDARAGFVVSAGDIVGEFEDPTAEEVPEDAAPRPFVMALDDGLDVLWTRDFVVQGGGLDFTDIVVDASGNTLLAGGLNGTLDLEGGEVTVDDPEHPDLSPREIVVIKLSPLGEHLWSRHVGLPSAYDLVQAQIGVMDDGTLSLSAVVDYHFFGDDASHDLIVSSISPEGEIAWIQGLREDDDPLTGLAINEWVATAVAPEGDVYVAAGVTGEGPFQYSIPEAPAPGAETAFAARFSTEGEHLWSERLPMADLARLAMETDAAGRVVIHTISGLASFTSDGARDWALESSPRPLDVADGVSEPSRSFDLDPASGDFVVVSEAITLPRTPGSEDYFMAIVTSRFSAEGAHLWTVRRESRVAGRVFLFRAVSIEGDDVFVLGTRFLPVEDHNDVAVVRRIAGGW